MQNKFAIIGIIIAAILVLGGIGLYLVNINRSEQEPSQVASTDVNEKASLIESRTLTNLLENNQTIQCTFSFEEEENSTNGVVYIDNERMRADITTLIDGVDSDLSMVRKENKNYIWGSAFPEDTGYLFESKLDEFEVNEEYGDYFDLNKRVEYNCENWKVTEESFDTPDDVEFSDLSSIVGEVVKEEVGESACSVCDSLEGESKDACLTGLNCQ